MLDIFCQAAISRLNSSNSSFPDGAAVAQLTVNQLVVGSNPTQGAKLNALEALLAMRRICNPETGSSILS